MKSYTENYFTKNKDKIFIKSRPINIEKTYGKKKAEEMIEGILSNFSGVKLKLK